LEKFEILQKELYNHISLKNGGGSMNTQKKFTVRDLAEIGVLAALVFVATYFLKIGPIPTPAGPI